MQIAQNTVVTMAYTLTDANGQLLDKADAAPPFAYLHGAQNIIPGLENALTGKQANDKVQVTIEPKDAYGERNDKLTQPVPRAMFGGVPEEKLVPGAQFQAQTNAGVEIVTITAVDGDTITIDANHPLAGVTLNFDVQILDVRTATQDEITHGHAHGAGGHHHH